ncbi:MAG: RNA polymerase sigma factor [Candidatus Ventricola sp.]
MDREEFESRVLRSQRKLKAIARRMLPPDECEDAVQSAILLAWEHLPQLKHEGAFEAWLTQILVNQCRQTLRQRSKEIQAFHHLQQLYDETVPQEIGLGEALDEMAPEARKLLLMRYKEGYSVSEIAQKLNSSEDAAKMRLYRARQRLRILLISLVLLLLMAAAAIGTGVWDVSWFLRNRQASHARSVCTDFRSAHSISYAGRYLTAELVDVKWDLESLDLLTTYSLAGTDEQALTVHSGCIGVDGERQDHIWVDSEIRPVEDWAQGKPVHMFTLDGWRIGTLYLSGSEDFLSDGLGESFFARLHLDILSPALYASLLEEDGMLTLQCGVTVRDFASNETLETGLLTLHVAAPDAEEWRKLYDAYNR